jgi:carboxymethylenebutenolidase
VALPSRPAEPHGAVVVLHGGYGVDRAIVRLAKRLSLSGYAAIVPDLFAALPKDVPDEPLERIKRLTWEGAKAKIQAAIEYVRTRGAMGPTAVLGYCMGGALALMAAADVPITTALLFYPHELYQPFGSDGRVPFDAVDRITVPLLAHFGERDDNPSPADAARLEERCSALGIPHQFYSYAGATHGFAGSNPERHDQIAANTAYDRTFGWLDRYLRPAPVGH